MQKVYIIIPCYNCINTIKRCIESVLNQTYKNIEIICVDDGSTDGTDIFLKKYNISYFYKQNSGPGDARNFALKKLMKNSYVTFLDSDDWIDLDYIQQMVSLIEKNNVDCVTSNFYFSNYDAEHVRNNGIIKNKILDKSQALNLLFDDVLITSHCHHKIFKTEVWDNIEFPKGSFYLEDSATLFKVFLNCNSILLSNYCGYHYFVNNSSITRSHISNQRILEGMKNLDICCLFDFDHFFSTKKAKQIRKKANSLFSDYFLEMYPRFQSPFSDEIRLKIKYYFKIARNKRVIHYKPSSFKNFLKKITFLIVPHIYSRLYRIFIK